MPKVKKYTRSENVGEVFYGKPGVMPSTMAKLELKSTVFIPEYFYLLMKSLEPKLKSLSRGGYLKRVSISDILSIGVQAPSYITQREVVDKISQVQTGRKNRMADVPQKTVLIKSIKIFFLCIILLFRAICLLHNANYNNKMHI